MVKERKIYTSFHDIPPREYMYFPKATVEPSNPGKFSSTEIKHILLSMFVLTIAFTFALSGNNLLTGFQYGFNLDIIPYFFILSLIGIITAFFFHELAHKLIAQKQGLWAEYRMYPKGLILALFLGLCTPFLFAAPGAVMFLGGSRSHETGKIAMAGPLTNILIAAISLVLYLNFFEIGFIGSIFGFICLINAFLATFNLLPFGPLDGVKIIRWNPTAWIMLLILASSILVIIWPRFQLVI